jgi:Protein of unknown function (DUF1619)
MTLLRERESSGGLGGSLFINEKTSQNNVGRYYNAGDIVHSEVSFNGVTSSWLNGNLPFPKPDINGNCNFYAGIGFMESSTTRCVNTVASLKNACTTLLNPQYLADNLRVLTGSDSVSDRVSVKVGDVYSLQLQTDNTVTYQPGSISNSAFMDGADCSCTGIIKEVYYKVYISPR